MSVDIFPTGIQSAGNNTWIATATKPTTVAAITAGVDVSCYFPADEIEIGFDQDREDDTRGCDGVKRETFGALSFSRDEIVHIVNPQGDGTEPGNLAVDAFPANETVYVSVRMGVKNGTTPVAADKWDVYMVELGGDHTTPLQAGKYVRRVKSAWTRVEHNVTFTA